MKDEESALQIGCFICSIIVLVLLCLPTVARELTISSKSNMLGCDYIEKMIRIENKLQAERPRLIIGSYPMYIIYDDLGASYEVDDPVQFGSISIGKSYAVIAVKCGVRSASLISVSPQ